MMEEDVEKMMTTLTGIEEEMTAEIGNEVAKPLSSTQSLADLISLLSEGKECVPFGEDIVDEFVEFTLQTPFSKQFFPKVLLVLADRCK